MSAQDIANLKAKIVAAVQERWKTRREPYLLSQLGKEFGAELRDFAYGRKLKEIIEQDFADVFRLGYDKVKLWYVVPVDVPPTDALAVLAGTRRDIPKFQLSIWAAFRKPLSAGACRFVVRDDRGFHFTDLSDGNSPSEMVFEIPSQQVCPPEMSSADVAGHIRAFFEASGLPLTDFLAKPTGERGRTIVPPAAERSQGSLLDALLAALGPADLRRILLPLDVVAKLRHRR